MGDPMDKYKEELTQFVRGVYVGSDPALVLGEGKSGAKVLLVGEAPGEQEALQKRPFVGKAGKNLDHFLELAGIERSEIYITNAVKLRPTKIGKSGRLSNRPPTLEEITLFRPWLLREIKLVAPKFVVTLGNVPLRAVTGKNIAIGQVHGTFVSGEVQAFALYHPASIIYNRSLAPIYEEDVLKLSKEILSTSDD